MTLFKYATIILAAIIGLACPVVLIPCVALIWVVIGRERAYRQKVLAATVAVEQVMHERERMKLARSL